MSLYPGEPPYMQREFNCSLNDIAYPDNVPRANRVRQLAQDIAQIQSQIKADVEDARANDAAAIDILNTIATNAGYKTLDEYVKDAADQLSEEDRAAFDKMKTDLEDLDEDMNISHKVFRGLIAVGLLTHGIRIFAIGFKETQSILFGLQAVLKAIYHAAIGAVETAVKFASWGRVTLNLVSKGGGITTEAIESMKFMKIGGNVLVAVGVIVDAALLIAEAIQGAEQRADLQKRMQQQARAILNFKSDAKSIVKMKSKYDDWVKKGRMTTEEVKEEMKPEMSKVETDMKTAMNKVTTKNVWDLLDAQDNDSQIAWKTEDPSLDRILQWIKDHPLKKDE
ncbi:hypothetical protein M413DRAFT_432905 [Hebeloma cylindrosporum]|uniref:Uncharacterized protein n=1 Tax=Hebeloma cylindrosporum TaxID=76867 RepID=A0A0C2Y1W4_HEBCY|nr:hypothetical protein M413DRAFT_432905 [Hebeloma cylindrosporum h7]